MRLADGARHGRPRPAAIRFARAAATVTLLTAVAVAAPVAAVAAGAFSAPLAPVPVASAAPVGQALAGLTRPAPEPAPQRHPAASRVQPLPKATPVRLQIPSLRVDSALEPLGLEADGAMQTPAAGFPAGWYTGAPTPGELGPAVIAGHVDWAGREGVFFDLHRLGAGDPVTVVRADGSAALFRVTRVAQYAKDSFPTEAVYADLDHSGLRLITCGGSFDRSRGTYLDNIVVFADLVGSRDGSGRPGQDRPNSRRTSNAATR